MLRLVCFGRITAAGEIIYHVFKLKVAGYSVRYQGAKISICDIKKIKPSVLCNNDNFSWLWLALFLVLFEVL